MSSSPPKSPVSSSPPPPVPAPGTLAGAGDGGRLSALARRSLILLLSINLFNYIDRYVLAAVEPDVRSDLLHEPRDPAVLATAARAGTFAGAANLPTPVPPPPPPPSPQRAALTAKTKSGTLFTAFVLSYMLATPLFGWLAERVTRWRIVAASALIWSAASLASGLAQDYTGILLARVLLGIGAAAYGPSAPTIIFDLYSLRHRGFAIAWFYMAIPLGTALGYAIGALVGAHFGWRMAFVAVAPPSALLAVIALFMRDPPRGAADDTPVAKVPTGDTLHNYLTILRTPSFLLDTIGMTAVTFAIGGISVWMPAYFEEVPTGLPPARATFFFGILSAVCGIVATLVGGWVGDWLRGRVRGAYFIVSATAVFCSTVFILLLVRAPYPHKWWCIFGAVFCLFFITGPANTILANVIHPSMRSTAFAINIFILHALGDGPAPTVMGNLIDRHSWATAFHLVCIVMAAGATLWVFGARFLAADTARAHAHARPAEAALPS